MSSPDLGSEFAYQAKDGEIVISLMHTGYPTKDIGPAYFISQGFEKPVSKATVKETDREAEKVKLEDALTKLKGTFARMKSRSGNVGVEIRDVYVSLLETEIDFIDIHKARIEKLKGQISENGKKAERVVRDYFKEIRSKRKQKEKEKLAKTGEPVDKTHRQYKKGINYENFFEAALINLTRNIDIQTLDRIPGNLPPHETPIPISENFQVGQLPFLRNESGHGTKVHSLLRTVDAPGDHSEIMTRGLRIGMGVISPLDVKRILQSSKPIIFDSTRTYEGKQGFVIMNPGPETLAEYKREISDGIDRNKRLTAKLKNIDEIRTLDGTPMKFSGNIAFADEMYAINENGATSVGLYRTEIAIKARWDLDLRKTNLEKFEEIYDEVAEASLINGRPKPITFRTPDFEADKALENMSKEDLKAYIKECDENMIRALMRTKKKHPDFRFHIMFPMIETAEQFHEMRDLVYKIAAEEGVDPPDCGAMIETPCAIKEMKRMDADFYSIGTNDLIPKILGFDRITEGHKYDPTHPEVLKALEEIHANAAEQGKSDRLSICGDLASDPRYLAVLIGLGYEHLSAGPGEIPFHKDLAMRIDKNDAKFLVKSLKAIGNNEQKREDFIDWFNEEYLRLYPNGTYEESWERSNRAQHTKPENNGKN